MNQQAQQQPNAGAAIMIPDSNLQWYYLEVDSMALYTTENIQGAEKC